MWGKDDAAAGKKQKQAVMHKLLTLTKASCNAQVAYTMRQNTAESSSQKPGSQASDAKIASYFLW